MPDNQKKSILSSIWDWLITYFGGNFTGVRNWLFLTTIFNILVISVLAGVFGLTIGTPLFFGLLIGFGAILLTGIVGSLVSCIFSLYNDYQEYKTKPGSEKHYLLDLLGRLWKWIEDHPGTTLGFALILGFFIYGMGSLFVLGAAVVAPPAVLFLSQVLGGLNATFLLSVFYSSAAFICINAWNLVSEIFSLFSSFVFPLQTTPSDDSNPLNDPNHTSSSSQSKHSGFTSPLIQPENNTATLNPGQMIRYNPTTRVLTEITENLNEPGSYTNKFRNGLIENITFIYQSNKSNKRFPRPSDVSSYLLIAYNPVSKEYFFLNISMEQTTNDPNVCQRFFGQFSGKNQDAKFDVLFFRVEFYAEAEADQIIPAKNTVSFTDSKDLISSNTPPRTDNMEMNSSDDPKRNVRRRLHRFINPAEKVTKVSFTLDSRQLTGFNGLNAPGREKYYPWDIDENQKAEDQISSTSLEKKS